MCWLQRSRPLLNPSRSAQRAYLLTGKHARADQEAHTLGPLKREHAPASRHHVQDNLRVFPILELAAAHIKRRLAAQGGQQHIAVADQELSTRIAHRRAAIAAAAG